MGRWGIDILLTAVAIAVGAPSLFYPLGRDQGLFFYIGREWLERGRLPYLDTFDIKTPGIYAVHAASIALLGRVTWGARALELVCVVTLGWTVSALAVRPSEGLRPGARGASAVAACAVYYGLFDFWNSGQCEVWCITCVMASAMYAARARGSKVRAWLSGTIFGFAIVFKTPAVIFAPCVLAYFARWPATRATLRASAAASACWALGIAMSVGAVLAYFGAHGALFAMYELLVVNMRYYVLHGAWVYSVWDVIACYGRFVRFAGPYMFVSLIVVVASVWRACRRGRKADIPRLLAPVAFALAATVAVTLQLKFAWYHWGLLVGPAALCAATAIEEAAITVPNRGSGATPAIAVAMAALILLAVSPDAGTAAQTGYRKSLAGALSRLTGRLTPREDLARFDYSTGYAFSAPLSQEIGEWLRAHTKAHDTVAIRSMEPQIYAVADRHHTGRFFWTTFLTYPQWSYRLDDWREEDRRTFVENPPDFVVAGAFTHEGPDSAEYFFPYGYSIVKSFGGWVVLGRGRTLLP